MYDRITLLGIGTLGGFIAESLVENEFCNELVIIDPDHVEIKNIQNSIYREIDVGDFKVDALDDILSNSKHLITIVKRREEFIEGETPIPNSDLVIDCRDKTYDREDLIDCRLHISSRYLVVDCRRNVFYKEHNTGRYIARMTRIDLKNASILFSNLIYNNLLDNLIKKQLVQSYDLDYFRNVSVGSCDLLYEPQKGEDKFLNLQESLLHIIEKNRKEPMELYVGSRTDPLSKVFLPKQILNSPTEIIQHLNSAIKIHCEYNNYFVVVNNNIIELIPEIGAA